LIGDLEAASTRLGISDNVAPARRGHSRTAAALTTRRQVERALLHLARADAAPAGNDREEAVLNARDRLDDARLSRPGPDLAGEVAIQINLAIVHLYQQDAEGALDQLRPAAARATAAGDVSGQAHALELTGVAAWMQRSPHEARRWWQHAEHLYAEIDEREGRARCLQHLGSAEVVAGRLSKARELLEQSALLRGDPDDHPTLAKYLEAARETGEVPVVTEEGPRQAAVGWVRRLIERWMR
jgi:tetratricopeptide (TPR) repeat protein